jgi:hypothetical protein
LSQTISGSVMRDSNAALCYPPHTLMASVVSGILNGVQASRLAKLAPDGAVPVETGWAP